MLKKLRTKVFKLINSRKFEAFLVLMILIAAFAVRLYKIDIPINDWHSWRQVDTAAVARIYVEEGINILYPKYYDISSVQTGYFNPEGLRFVEFPLYNIAHALAFESFPQIQFEIWGRLISVLSSLVTAICVYFIAKRESRDKIVSLASLFFFCFIPFNIFYSRVILPEPMAAMFAVSSILFFVKYYDSDKKLFLFTSSILFSAGLLIKPYTLFYALPIAYLAIKKFGIKKLITNIPLLIALDIALIPVFLWRAWIDSGANIIGIPFVKWVFNGDGIRFRPAWWRWIFGERLGYLILGVWGIVPFVFGLIAKSNKLKLSMFMILAALSYVVVIATASVRHDYYQSILIPAIALILGIGAGEMWKMGAKAKVILSVCVVLMLGMGWYQIKEFYKINHPEFVEVGKIVDESVAKDARLIVPDNGNTVFLYYTHRRGWPVLQGSIEEFIGLGADYFVSVNNDADTNMLKNKFNIFKQGPNYWIIDLNSPK